MASFFSQKQLSTAPLPVGAALPERSATGPPNSSPCTLMSGKRHSITPSVGSRGRTQDGWTEVGLGMTQSTWEPQ